MIKITKGDINAYFGLLLNNLANLIVLVSLLTSIGFPSEITVFRIIPGVTFAIFVGSILYYIQAIKLKNKEGRDDVTTLPTGLSVPHMFLIVYTVILPVFKKTNDPYLAFRIAIMWTFFEGLVETLGAFVGPFIRKVIPRAALLGSLAGVSLIYIALRPMIVISEYPYLGFICLTIILLGWVSRKNYFSKIPIGLLVIVVGIIIGIFTGYVNFNNLLEFSKLQFNLPKINDFNLFLEIKQNSIYLISALPLGIYNFLETMDNLESASAAGDNYDTRNIMLIDGFSSILGSFFGSCFPTALYIGHPGWKKMGGRLSYSLLSGFTVFLLGILGIIKIFSVLIPDPAVLPILAFIGLSIAEQAIKESKKEHAMAIFIAIFPWLADYLTSVINSTINSTILAINFTENIDFSKVYHFLNYESISYKGLSFLGSGAIIISLIWSSFIVYIIDDKLKQASYICIVAGILSMIGIIHSPSFSFNIYSLHFISYIIMAIMIIIIYFINKKGEKYEKN